MRKKRNRKHRRSFYTPSDKAWLKAHPEFSTSSKTTIPGNCTRLMWASNEYFTAGAVWQRRDGFWSCVEAAPILKWMKGMDPTAAKVELARRGCEWQWMNDRKSGELDPDTATVGGSARSEAGDTTRAALGTVNRGCPALP